MTPITKTVSRWRAATKRWFARPKGWFIFLMALWWVMLGIFHAFPAIDLSVAQAFFEEAACGQGVAPGRVCGTFFYGEQTVFVVIRQVLFYLPVAAGVYLLYRLIRNLGRYGLAYSARQTRDYAIAVLALLAGPYLLVNLVLKEFIGRPRPYQTDFFGGSHVFTAAGDIGGTCARNCSFISGEGAGSGWLACLIVLMPKPLRPVLGPPLIIISLIAPALRISFGGHYLSDVSLGWLSSLVVYAGVAACFEMSQRAGKRNSPTLL